MGDQDRKPRDQQAALQALLQGQRPEDGKRAQLRQLIQEEPERVAAIVRAWLAEEQPRGRGGPGSGRR